MSTAVLTHFASAPAVAAGRPLVRKPGLMTRLFTAFYQSRRRHAAQEVASVASELARQGLYVNETKALLDDIRNVSLVSDAKLPFTR